MNLASGGQLYVTTIAAAGLMILGHCISSVVLTPIKSEWLILALLTLLTGSFTIKVPKLRARISVSEAFVFTSVILFGTCAGTITVALDALIAAFGTGRPARQPIRILFNLASATLSIWAASHLFYGIAGVQPLADDLGVEVPSIIPALVALTLTYFLLNSWLVAAAIAFERDDSWFDIWRKNFLWLGVNYFGGASVAALLVSYTRTIDFLAAGIIIPLLVISYLTYKTSFSRVEDATRHVDEIKRLHLSTIETLATAIDAKDQVTHGHIRRVQRFALGLANELGVTDEQQIKALEAAALLHDTGKLVVPEHILNKPGRLSSGEFEKMKLHASVGAEILSAIKFPFPIVPIVRHHHENWDGTGYPDRLRGTEIPIGARILAVVDCFDALTSDRPYRRRLNDEDAMRILLERRGSMYDPLVVDTFANAREQLTAALTSAEARSELETIFQRSSRDRERLRVLPSPSIDIPVQVANTTKLLLESALNVTSSECLILLIKDTKTDELIEIAHAGLIAIPESLKRVQVGARVSGWVAANGRPIVNADAALEFADGDTVGWRWCTCVPLEFEHQTVGTLTAFGSRPSGLTTESLAALERVARQLTNELRAVFDGLFLHAPPSINADSRVH